MKGKHYSSRDQERFFQPRRIQVLHQRRDNYGSQITWNCVVWNAVTGRVEDVLTGSHKWENQWVDVTNEEMREIPWHTYGVLTKADTVEVAKWWAQKRELPFDLQADILPYADIALGPERECVICGKPMSRGHAPDACEQCRADRQFGASAGEPRIEHAFSMRQPVRGYYGVGDKTKLEISNAVVKLAQSSVKDCPTYVRTGTPRIGEGSGSSYGDWWYTLDVTAKQADAANELLRAMRDALSQAVAYGRKEGSNLLKRLASGELHPNDFAERREGRRR